MKKVDIMFLNYGNIKLELTLPSGLSWEIIEPSFHKPLAEPEKAILTAISKPLNSLPLQQIVRPGETICLLVNDSTRVARSELFLPLLVKELLRLGTGKDDIFIVFTNGSHRPLARSEMAELVGDNVASTVAMYNHDSRNSSELVYIEETSFGTPVYINKKVIEADRRILTGSVVHHFFAGFGGGRKALVPGVAGWETIQKNHSLMLHDKARSGVLDGNPVHEDLLEAALMIGCDFMINTVLNENKEILGVFAGDMVEAHLAACALTDQVNGVKLQKPADVVIASCGGNPKDINLYQAHKTLDNAMAALKPGGQMIFLAKCPEGIGSDNFEEWALRYHSLNKLEKALKKDFVLGGHKAYAIAKLLQRGKVHLLSDLEPEKARMLGFNPLESLEEGLELVYRDNKELFTYIIPQGSLVVPSYR
jgi:lactate racemase